MLNIHIPANDNNAFEVGHIVTTSQGYSMTRWAFAVITKRTPKGAVLQPLKTEYMPHVWAMTADGHRELVRGEQDTTMGEIDLSESEFRAVLRDDSVKAKGDYWRSWDGLPKSCNTYD